jgi:Disaggregatase related
MKACLEMSMKLLPAPLFVAGVVFSLVGAAHAQVLRVPSQHATIATALAAAKSGDTILVAAGVYKESLTWPATDGIRLFAEEGPGKTTIDANKTGRVILFGSKSITRATILEGFTVTGGLMKTTRNHGAGIHIQGASPTIRGNKIAGNLGDGTSWNYGGGLYIYGAGANPLIIGNEITNNTLQNGSWNYGAGIYLSGGAGGDILSNYIHKNRNLTVSSTSTGRGHGAGIFCDGPALIASNLIVGNINNTSGWNYGGAIKVDRRAIALVINNTLAGNQCVGKIYNYGGGCHMTGVAKLTFVGNIVANNVVSGGSFRGGGGVFRDTSTGGSSTLDHNDVWGNTGGDYSGVTKGKNSISVDPQFVSTSDWHLKSGSPCVDAIPATHLTSAVAMDFEQDPRRLDGDLDGGKTNGARLDIGADEFTDLRLIYSSTPKLGSVSWFTFAAPKPSIYVLFMDLKRRNLYIGPYGNLLLSFGLFLTHNGLTSAKAVWIIPNVPALRGLTTHHQALFIPLPNSGAARLSNVVSLTIY